MSTNKGRKTAQSIRYLLSADSRLRKLSLRKMSARVKTTKREPSSKRIKNLRPVSSLRLGGGTQMAILGTVFLLAAAVLMTARQPSPPDDLETVIPQTAIDAPPANVARVTSTKKAAVSKSVSAAAVTQPNGPKNSAGAAPATTSAGSPDAAVTITGCLQRDDDTFWLNDTSGVAAPKSRGWRSGFLTRRSSPVRLVGVITTLNVPDYVGQRVEATGVLVKREMRARSLRRVAGSCD